MVAVRLADNALTFARSHGYHLAGRPEVWLIADPAVDRGQVEVNAVTTGTAEPGPAEPAPAARLASFRACTAGGRRSAGAAGHEHAQAR